MNRDVVMPHIARTWNARQGRFVWSAGPEPQGKWGMGISAQLRYDYRQAVMWCAQQNEKEKANGRPALPAPGG